jgi:hypothetical protein
MADLEEALSNTLKNLHADMTTTYMEAALDYSQAANSK